MKKVKSSQEFCIKKTKHGAHFYEPCSWEHREFKDYAKEFFPSMNAVWKRWKEKGLYPGFNSFKEVYDYEWSWPEAEAIHAAFIK